MIESGDRAVFRVTTSSEDPYSVWLPFCDFDGMFAESIPMQAAFTVPLNRKEEAVEVMKQNGYTQHLL